MTLPVTPGLLIATVLASLVATGASFTGVMLKTWVATGEVRPAGSVTVNGMLTVPLKLGAGVKIKPAACAGERA